MGENIPTDLIDTQRRCQGRFDDMCSQMLEQCDESLLQKTKHALLLDN